MDTVGMMILLPLLEQLRFEDADDVPGSGFSNGSWIDDLELLELDDEEW